MRTILLKDVRLSLDALLPWALVLGGVVIAMLGLAVLPSHLRPAFAWRFTVAEALGIAGALIGVSAIGVSAWAAVMVVQGDRRHGAWLLDWSLPVSRRARTASKVIAAMAACAASPLAFIAVLVGAWMASPSDGRFAPSIGLSAFVVAMASLAGTALALGVAPWVQGAFKVVLLSLLLGVAGALAGGLGGWLGFGWAIGDYVREGVESYHIDSAWRVASWAAAIAGASAVALVAGIWGVSALARPAAPKVWAVGGALALALALALGSVGSMVGARDELARVAPTTAVRLGLRALSDGELAELVRGLDEARRLHAGRSAEEELEPGWSPIGWLDHDGWQVLLEAQRRLRLQSREERTGSALGRAMQAGTDFSTPALARSFHLFLIPGDSSELNATLRCVLHHPDEPFVRRLLLQQLLARTQRPGGTDHRRAFGESPAETDALFRDQIKTWLPYDKENRELLQAVLDS